MQQHLSLLDSFALCVKRQQMQALSSVPDNDDDEGQQPPDRNGAGASSSDANLRQDVKPQASATFAVEDDTV